MNPLSPFEAHRCIRVSKNGADALDFKCTIFISLFSHQFSLIDINMFLSRACLIGRTSQSLQQNLHFQFEGRTPKEKETKSGNACFPSIMLTKQNVLIAIRLNVDR